MLLPPLPRVPPVSPTHNHPRSPTSSTPRPPLFLIILSAIIGLALILLAALLTLLILRRRRRTHHHFHTARLRDPHLTWDQYSRRRTMTRSRLSLEAEMQRARMIRKSLQTRSPTPDDDSALFMSSPVESSPPSPSPISPLPRACLPEWRSWGDEKAEKNCGEVVVSGDELWRLRDDGTWHLAARSLRSGEGGEKPVRLARPMPARPMPARPKTPSLFSHPAFRGLRFGGSEA